MISVMNKKDSFRNIIILSLLLLISASIIRYMWSDSRKGDSLSCDTHQDKYAVLKVTIDHKHYNVLVADSPAKWEYGLMNVKSKKDICGHDGMIFTFPIAIPQTFWNKNTLVDLDIYWMKGEKKVGQDRLPAITKSGLTTVSSPEAVDRVVEIIR